MAQARLARAVLAQARAQNPRQIAEADWLSTRALQFAPIEPEASWARAEALERAGKVSAALEMTKGALRMQPQNPELWLTQGRLLGQTNRWQEAVQAYTKAIELTTRASNGTSILRQKAFAGRAAAYRGLGETNQAAADLLSSKGTVPRVPATPTR